MNDSRKRRGTKAEWVAVMALIAERDRPAYRVIRQEAWENLRFEMSSTNSN